MLGSTRLLISGAEADTLTHDFPVNTFVLVLARVFCVAVGKMLTCEDIIETSSGGITGLIIVPEEHLPL